MKVYIFNTSLKQGGAAIAAYRLKKGLEKLDCCDVFSVVKEQGNAQEPNCIIPESKPSIVWQVILNNFVLQNRSNLSTTYYDVYYRNSTNNINQIIDKKDSVLNIHWVANFLSIENFLEISKLNLPTVWTLHDEAAYTGGCHYTAGCDKFQKDCENCPQLENDKYYIPRMTLEHKKNVLPGNLVIVTPSRWLSSQAKKSRLFKENPIHVIPNGVDTDIFRPHNKNEVRKRLGISNDVFLMLFGAQNNAEKRKGFFHLLEVIDYLKENKKFNELISNQKIKIVTFGKPSNEIEKTGFGVENVGFIEDENKLSEVYSASDLFLLPSLEDNLPNTMLESMACGTPVLGFNIGGLPDVIKPENGLLISPFNTREMADQLMAFYNNQELQKQLSKASRQTIVENFTLEHQASRYCELFDQLLKDNLSRKGAVPEDKHSSGHYDFSEKIFYLFQETAENIISNNTDELLKRNNVIQEKNGQLRLKDELISLKNNDIRLKNDEIRRKENLIRSKDEQIQLKINIIQEKLKLLQLKNKLLEDKQSLLITKSGEIQNLNQKIKKLQNDMSLYQNETKMVLSSRSFIFGYYVLHPYKIPGALLRKIRRKK